MRIFEHKLDHSLSTDEVTSEITFNSIKQAVSSMRAGIGYSSKILICHTSIVDQLRKLINENLSPKNNPDLHIIKPYRVIGHPEVPKIHKKYTGKYIFKKNRFIDYNFDPHNSRLTYTDYIDMCLYFGWAEKEYISIPVCYELETDNFLDCIMSSMRLRQFKKIEEYILTGLS